MLCSREAFHELSFLNRTDLLCREVGGGRDSNACVIVQEARTVVRAFPGTGIVSCRRGLASASKRG
jgi:hypothetical protein